MPEPKPAHHGDDGRFRNPPGSPRRDVSRATMAAFLWRFLRDKETPRPPAGLMLDGAAARARMTAAANPSITWLGHACFLIRLGGKVVLTDPYLGVNAGPLWFGPKRFAPPPVAVDELPPIDLLLISHNHYDHIDLATLDRLAGKQRMTAIAPLRVGRLLRARGFAQVVELDWWQSLGIDEVEIQALPAVHFSGRGPFDRNKTLWASFAIRSKGLSLWFSGDTAPGAVFEEIGARAGPFDLAMIGIGAYEPRAIMKSSHATPEEAIGIVQAVRAGCAIGMHWGTVKLTAEDAFVAPLRYMAAARRVG